jgi:hypothetical protein
MKLRYSSLFRYFFCIAENVVEAEAATMEGSGDEVNAEVANEE